MTGQYCFPGDSPEWGDPAKTSRGKFKTRVKTVMCSSTGGVVNIPVVIIYIPSMINIITD